MRACRTCGAPLTGRQLLYCSQEISPDCKRLAARAAWVYKTYGITLAEWDAIFRTQGGRCAICGRAPRPGEVFHLDHEHAAGQSGPIRGILCPYCNTRLVGRLKSHQRAQALADYLRDPPAPRALGRTVIAPGRPRTRRRRQRR